MTSLFSSPKTPTQAAPPAPPTVTDPAVQQAANENAAAAASAAGRGSTILTSGLGDTSQATVQKKVLLGG